MEFINHPPCPERYIIFSNIIFYGKLIDTENRTIQVRNNQDSSVRTIIIDSCHFTRERKDIEALSSPDAPLLYLMKYLTYQIVLPHSCTCLVPALTTVVSLP